MLLRIRPARHGAAAGIRTRDLRLTRAALCRLSYGGAPGVRAATTSIKSLAVRVDRRAL